MIATEGAQRSAHTLAAHKAAIVEAWLTSTYQTYPDLTFRFLSRETDPFRNPVGHTLSVALAALFDELLGAMDAETVARLLDPIMRIRAVQDFTADRAVAFVFALKDAIREAAGAALDGAAERELEVLDARIDEMAARAVHLFESCRAQLHQVEVNEAKRRAFVVERIRTRHAEAG